VITMPGNLELDLSVNAYPAPAPEAYVVSLAA
jgi:hypothetical protein